MIVTFCGHAQFQGTEQDEQRILDILEETVGEQGADMYLGGYGAFDRFAFTCCKKYQKKHPAISLVLVTPYLSTNPRSEQSKLQQAGYDWILYPEIEDKPKRYAISYRNRYMVEKADCVIAYVSHAWGGAYTTYRYAKRKGKKIFNLSAFSE